MPTSNYGAFNGGVTIQNLPILNSYGGNVYWVDSGSSGNKGTFERPFKTLASAIAAATANNGDMIMVKQGHTETITAAAGLVIDKAGLTFIGLGTGSDRPTINFTTSTAADVDIDAANTTIENFLFTSGIDALATPIDANAADFTMRHCETRDVTGQTVNWISTDANCDRLLIDGLVHRGATAAGAESVITMTAGNHATIIPYFIDGNFSSSAIRIISTAGNFQLFGSANYPAYLRNRNASDSIFSATSTTTGRVGPYLNARLADNAANITEAFAGADMEFFQPINIVNADGESSLQTNITASTDA